MMVTTPPFDSAIYEAAESLCYSARAKEMFTKKLQVEMIFCVIANMLWQTFVLYTFTSNFDFLRGVKNKSIVVVVSPLTALMKDQVLSITEMGLSAAVISDKETTSSTFNRAWRISNCFYKS